MGEKQRLEKAYASTLNVHNSATIGGALTVSGNTAIAGNVTIAGNLTVTGSEEEGSTPQTATTADLNLLTGMAAAGDGVKKVAKVALAAVDTAGGIFAWANPEAGAIVINKLTIDVTTAATGAVTIDAGTTTVSATTLSDNLVDGLDGHTSTVTADNFSAAGTNGKDLQKLASGKWVTGSTASGASAGIVGNVYIEYMLL